VRVTNSIRQPRSLTLAPRLIMSSIVAAVLALLVANIFSYLALNNTLLDQTDASLRAVRIPKRGDDQVRRLAPDFFLEERAANGAVIDGIAAVDSSGNTIRPSLPTSLDLSGTTIDPNGQARFFTVDGEGSAGRFRVKAAAFDDGRALIIGVSMERMESTLRRSLLTQLLATAGFSAIVAVLAAIGVRRSLRPLTDLEQTAAAIAAGDRGARVEPGGPADVHQLGRSFNRMVDRLDDSITAEADAAATSRRFLDDAAHELRTPISAVVAYAELMAGHQHGELPRTPEESSRIAVGLLAETRRLASLADQLLYLARVDQGEATLSIDTVDLVPIAQQAVDLSLLLGPAWPIDLDTPDHAWVDGSSIALRRVFDNLLTNIRTHTPPGTPGRVQIRQHADGVTVLIADNGPGVAAGDRAHLFDRFWRSDRSRARATGGTGLGLAIVESIVRSHSGTIDTSTQSTTGLTVEITLPSKPCPRRHPKGSDSVASMLD
jgi:two-component system, OmpR family, sensor kinase